MTALTIEQIAMNLDDEAKEVFEFLQELQKNDITASQLMAHYNNLHKLERQIINTLYFCGRLTGNKWKVQNLSNQKQN